jgi:hypothetical protein
VSINRKPGPLSRFRLCYAVDLSATTVLLRAERGRRGLRLSRVAPDDPAVQSDLARGVPCVGSMPSRRTFMSWVQTPFPPSARARRVLPTLLDITLPFPIEDCCFAAVQEARDAAGRLRALAVGARHADVKRRLDAYRAAGWDPAALDDAALCAWSQAAAEAPAEAPEAFRAVVCMDRPEAFLVLGTGGELSGAYGLDADEPAASLARLLRAKVAPGTPVRWIWLGADATPDRIAALTRVLSGEWPGPSTILPRADEAVARALARRALGGEPDAFNYRSGPLTHPALARQAGRGLLVMCGFALAGCAALCCVLAADRVRLSLRERELDHATRRLASELAGYEVTARGAHAYSNVLHVVTGLQPFMDMRSSSASPVLASILRTASGHDLRLALVSAGANEAAVSGDAARAEAIEALAAALRSRQLLVEPGAGKPGPEGRIPFSLTAREEP